MSGMGVMKTMTVVRIGSVKEGYHPQTVKFAAALPHR